mmetsp:Transcript_32288/g.51702  ORF Transcript_32288/g.51702 Transcript_32288/m.51702 type:complete len:369 (+) Transcript_32288:583-1689(+)
MAAPTPPRAYDGSRATARVLALSELWVFIAAYSGIVGAWRLTAVCKAAREGVKEHLRSLPGLVVIYEGTETATRKESDVWRLNLASLQWESMPALVTARVDHACCAVRGSVAVIGGRTLVGDKVNPTASVEVLSSRGGDAPMSLPPLSCGGIDGAAAIAVGESDSAAGQVLLLGGTNTEGNAPSTAVHLVDLATGTCTPQPALLYSRCNFSAVRMSNGRVVCAGGLGSDGTHSTIEVWGSSANQASHAASTWTQLPSMIDGRFDCCGCVMSNGCLAMLGGKTADMVDMSSCEVPVVGEDEQWHSLPPMHQERSGFACAAIAGCIIVSGGQDTQSAEVYDEVRNQWILLPCSGGPFAEEDLLAIGSAVL